MSSVPVVAVVFALLSVTGCNRDREEDRPAVREVASGLSAFQQDVLGFERPTVDWFSTAPLTESTNTTQGDTALAVVPQYWTEITSVPLASLGPVGGTVSVDIRAPEAVPWGQIRFIAMIPSLGFWQDFGGVDAGSLTPGDFETITFSLPSSAVEALGGTYNDLQLRVVLNVPIPGAPYVIDNILLGQGSEPSESELSVFIPQGQTRGSMFLSASQYLQVDDRVEVGSSGALNAIAGLGVGGVQIGSLTVAHSNIYSVGDVWVRSQGVVDGFVRTEGTVDEQDGSVQIHGPKQQGVEVPFSTFSWAVEFPEASTPLPVIEQVDEVTLSPGAYQNLDVHGGRVHLSSGIYYFSTFNTEPQSVVEIHNEQGPVFIYVKAAFNYKGPFEYPTPSAEGQLLVGYFGTSAPFLQAPFVGTMVAPSAQIALHRPTSLKHKGTFFGERIQVFSDSQILPLAFDWGSLPGGPDAPNTDGDMLPDPEDVCLLDPEKGSPLLCGCGEEEVDSDGDSVPDCVDPCPLDPDNAHFGTCGCLNEPNLQPVGVPCVVEACSGSGQEATCDGAGHCGVPDCEVIPGNCFYRVFGDSLYWICQGPVDWEEAESLCRDEPGRALVQVDSLAENLWLGALLEESMWLGGSELTTDNVWSWSNSLERDHTLFYFQGLPVPGRFENWAAGTPGTGSCLTLLDGGLWTDAECTVAQGFVCEQPLRWSVPQVDLDVCNFFPGLSCPASSLPEFGGPCEDPETEFPASLSAMEAIAADCIECGDDEVCAAQDCVGFATPPDPGSCSSRSLEERTFCVLDEYDENESCTKENPVCSNPEHSCGLRIECAALDAAGESTSCVDDTNCQTGEVCGTLAPFCMAPNKRTICDDDGLGGNECLGLCFTSFWCGLPAPDCAANDDNNLLDRCDETLLCFPTERDVDIQPLPDSNLIPETFVTDTFFPEPEELDAPYPSAKPDGCGGEGEPDCDFQIGDHPWCAFVVDQEEAPTPRQVSDADPPFDDKRGSWGDNGSPIHFDFDPNLSIDYSVDPLPLGDAEFNVGAMASANASAGVSLFGVGGSFEILDALAEVRMKRCSLSADAKLALFGRDFLPALLGDSYEDLENANTSEADIAACENGLEDFKESVSRAQKALRDAQELIRQHQELLANGMRFSPDLCEQLLAGDKGLPAQFPFTTCDGLSPEDTINLFVQYYRGEIARLRVNQASALQETTPRFPTLSVPFLGDLDSEGNVDTDFAHRETTQIASVTIPIGPIPVNMVVEAYVQYGLAGTIDFSLTPGNLLQAYQDGQQAPLANVAANAVPFAGAGVTLFVGVGFDFGALSASVGIEGDVSLGVVSLPMYAGAGVGVQTERDPRPLAADFEGMVDSTATLLPVSDVPRKYRFDGFYKFGADVRLTDLLSGKISGRLRIKFFFFSKTWRVEIAEFDSPFDDINFNLISGQGSTNAAEDFGILGRVRMPVPFLDLKEIPEAPPLPPLPEPEPDVDAGSPEPEPTSEPEPQAEPEPQPEPGVDFPVSLRAMSLANLGEPQFQQIPGDPRLQSFDPGRAVELFYDGYCHCSEENFECARDIQCCDDLICVFDDTLIAPGACRACVGTTNAVNGGGQICSDTSECCQGTPQSPVDPVVCYPLAPGLNVATYCQACKGHNEAFIDNDADGQPDFGECCPGLIPFSPPDGPPVCSNPCRDTFESCNQTADCCNSPPETCSDDVCKNVDGPAR